MTVVHDLGLWLWRLLPANPILLRVVSTAGKRSRHLWARAIYLCALFVILLITNTSLLTADRPSLAELAKQSTHAFLVVSMAQLFLMSFIAPIFAAGAITQEKDANTFHILLTTPLSSAQIVLGMLFSRLYFVWVLLLSGLPILSITMIYGGVTWAEVRDSLLLAACTALITGSLAIAISVAKVGTRKTIFSFFVGVATYLLAVGAYGLAGLADLPEAEPGVGSRFRLSWVAPLHPFLALLSVTGQTPPPPPGALHHYGWPWSWALGNPQYAYVVLTTVVSAFMIVVSLFFVRGTQKEGEITLAGRMRAALLRTDGATDKRKKPRSVWNNPIAWREAATRGAAGGRSAMRWVYVVGGLAVAVILLIGQQRSWWGLSPAQPAVVRDWLTALVWIEFTIALLIVTNTAATTLTREREAQTIELLLVTPLTSKYIIWGMLRGLVSFVLPLLFVPTATLLMFAIADLFRGGQDVTTLETVLLAPALMTAFVAVAAMVGLQFSLVSRKTVQAVMISTAIVLGAAGVAWGCGQALRSGAAGVVSAAVLPFTPYPALQAIIHHDTVFRGTMATTPPTPSDFAAARWVRALASLIAVGAYAGVTYSLYAGLVRNFDMTIRRQSAAT